MFMLAIGIVIFGLSIAYVIRGIDKARRER